ncbi:MAG: molybdate ABC transporter substrate-binding protein [Rhodothermales bacterium]
MGIRDRARGLAYGLTLALGLLAGCAPPATDNELTLFVAASLTDVAEDMARAFEQAHPGMPVRVHAAASSVLARQIDEGAPADVFFLANEAWSDYLVDRGRVEGTVRRPVSNRLVLIARRGAPAVDSLLRLPANATIALADPEHVPAGIYAREALVCLGQWDRLAASVLPALDVRAALHTVDQGVADYGIVYATDIPSVPAVDVRFVLPSRCQPDIRYTLGRVRQSTHPQQADQLVAFLMADARAADWERYGFVRCVAADTTGAAPC